MTALSADKNVQSRKSVELTRYYADVAAVIYKGGLVCIDADGYARAGADTAGFQCVGVSDEKIAAGSADGDRSVDVVSGRDFLLTGANLTQAMVGKPMFLVDDGTVGPANDANNDIFVGTLVEYVSATSGWVRIPPYPQVAIGSPTAAVVTMGGAVTQITSAATAVTLDKMAGQITTVALTTAGAAEEAFVVNNELVDANDIVIVSTTYAGAGKPIVSVTNVGAGVFTVNITNVSASALDAVVVVNFMVIKSVAS